MQFCDKKRKMVIWIINEYAGSPYHGMEFRHYYIGKELVKRGYKVYIITASYSHLFINPPSVCRSYKIENVDGINYVWIKVPQYKNSLDKMRVLKWFVFAFKTLFVRNLEKPDIIIVSPMAPFVSIPAYILARKNRAKFVFEVKDIWPLSIVELKVVSKKHPLIKLMEWSEIFSIRKADCIVSTLRNYSIYLLEKGILKEFKYINNGIETNLSDCNIEFSFMKIPENRFVVGYTGNIGISNSVEYLLRAAQLLNSKGFRDKIYYVLVGDGYDKKRFEKDYTDNNIVFWPPVPKNCVNKILQMFDVCFKGSPKKKIYEYGVSAYKIFDYMLAAKPILHSYSGEGDLIKEANCGITVEAENPEAIAEGILKLYNMSPEERKRLGENGRKYVLEHHTYEKIADKFEEVFRRLS